MNAKVTYYETFLDAGELPTVEDVAEYIADDLGLEHQAVKAELTRMDIDGLGRVDENMFLALYFGLDEEQEKSFVKADWALFTSRCDRCSRLRLSKAFLRSNARILRSHCFECRGDDLISTHPKHIFCPIDVDILQGELLSVVHFDEPGECSSYGAGC